VQPAFVQPDRDPLGYCQLNPCSERMYWCNLRKTVDAG
jgi:hypothetical protein